MRKPHNTEWYAKQEARLQEPLKNTKRYYGKSAMVKICTGFPPLMIWGLVQLIRVYLYINNFSNLTADYMQKGRAVTNDGPPGAGKTFTGGNVAYFLAQERWEQLKSDYFTQKTLVERWLRTGDTEKLEAFKALEESYLFYKEREETNIPCLVSSIPLREYGTGRMSYQLTPEMFLQIERTPEYTVYFNDESGKDQGADTSKTENKDLLAFWRLPRHFFDGMFVNTNQDGDQNAIYMRRSTDFVNHIFGQEWVMRPLRLERKYARKERRYFKRLAKGRLSAERAEYIGQGLYFLKKYKATIGFRRVTCRTTTKDGVAVGDIDKVILPAIGGVQYDDRAYRNQYKCKDKPIKLKGWEKLVMDEQDTTEFDEQVKGTDDKPKRRGK